MKNFLLITLFVLTATVANAQLKLNAGIAFANNGPKAEIGYTEYYPNHNLKIKTSLSYTFEKDYSYTSSETGETKIDDIHHLAISSVILYEVKKLDIGGGVSYRFFLPNSSGSVGLELVGQYHFTDKIAVQAIYDRTLSGFNYTSLGVNYYLF